MDNTTIREKLHEYINTGDVKLLKLMYAVAKEYSEDDDANEYVLSEAEIHFYEARSAKRLSGESETFNWQDAKEKIRGNTKAQQAISC